MLAWRKYTVGVCNCSHQWWHLCIKAGKIIFFGFCPPRRERASEVTVWCQKDPSKVITRTLPPGFSLPVTKPLSLLPGHFKVCLAPTSDPGLCLGLCPVRRLWWAVIPGARAPLTPDAINNLSHGLLLPSWIHRCILPKLSSSQWAHYSRNYHLTSNPTVSRYSPHLMDKPTEAQSNWMTCSSHCGI